MKYNPETGTFETPKRIELLAHTVGSDGKTYEAWRMDDATDNSHQPRGGAVYDVFIKDEYENAWSTARTRDGVVCYMRGLSRHVADVVMEDGSVAPR